MLDLVKLGYFESRPQELQGRIGVRAPTKEYVRVGASRRCINVD